MLRCFQLTIRIAHGLLSCSPSRGFAFQPSQSLRKRSSCLSDPSQDKQTYCSARDVTRSSVGSGTVTLVRVQPSSDIAPISLGEYLNMEEPRSIPPRTLIAMYRNARSRGQPLSQKHLSQLIAIFGSLSLPVEFPRIKNRYVKAMGALRKTSHWDFVNELIVEKETVGYLSNGDRYWRLCSRLAEVRTTGSDFHSKERVVSFAIADAIVQYRHIWRRTLTPDVLTPYFDALLSQESMDYVSTAVHQLCDLLDEHRHVHAGIIRIVWRVALVKPENLSDALKEKLLSTLWSRTQIPFQAIKRSRAMATHFFNHETKRHQRVPFGIRQLNATLTTPLFPFFYVSVPLPVRHWSQSILEASLSPANPLSIRWSNLSLLAFFHSISGSQSLHMPLSLDSTEFTDWHAALMTGILETVISSYPSPDDVRGLVRLLWQRWRQSPHGNKRPSFVIRAFVSACFRLAGHTKDVELCHECYRYSVRHNLFLSSGGVPSSERVQADSLMNHCVQAFLDLPGQEWATLFQSIDIQPPEAFGRQADLFIQSLVSRDPNLAHQLYKHCIRHSIPLSGETQKLLMTGLVAHRPSATISVLDHWVGDVRPLLLPILRSLGTCRLQHMEPLQAKILGSALLKHVATQKLTSHFKRPIQHCLYLFITANRAEDAVQIVDAILKHKPSYFSASFLKRLLQLLLRHRQFRLSIRLANLFGNIPPAVTNDIRETLVLGLLRGGASNLARRLAPPDMPRSHEVIARIAGFRKHPSRITVPKVPPVSRHSVTDLPSFTFAFLLVLNSARPSIPSKVLMSALSQMDPTTKTLLVNTYLNHLTRRSQRRVARNRRVFRSVVHMKDFFVQRAGFSPDRVTTNIFVKALMRSNGFDAVKVRALFDHLTRHGYPVAERWRRENNVPFGTVPLPPGYLQLSFPEGPIEFQKHCRPLYKMFIKALHRRRDVTGAKMIVGILKDEEAAYLLGKGT
ncbi:hypothetical protein WG66_008607 [Moniliophthora roreri]|nr:hypothetical protein WG66_008607 [Moniliophthora roreri]